MFLSVYLLENNINLVSWFLRLYFHELFLQYISFHRSLASFECTLILLFSTVMRDDQFLLQSCDQSNAEVKH